MSFTGFWMLTTAADEQIQTWRERYADELAAGTEHREQVMAWWADQGDVAFIELDDRHGWVWTEASRAFCDVFYDVASDDLVQEVIERIGEAGQTQSFGLGARKSSPAAALYHALGAVRAARMPGCLGDFLLTADQAAAALSEVEGLLTGADREDLVASICVWLDELADGPRSKGAELVDGVLRVFREAVDRELGVAAVVACF
ncbi:hypothetical protein ABH926_007641 [Catenulispora sp. GP43]|uniref:hypothetical protein n=1 Tax=Catenulispora sp. GP43 TaxID=3156263 RepID=UPI003512C4A7